MYERDLELGDLTIEQAIEDAEEYAKEETDGHFTLMRFTTGWKAMMSTPDLDTGDGRNDVYDIPMEDTIQSAIMEALHRHVAQKEGKNTATEARL